MPKPNSAWATIYLDTRGFYRLRWQGPQGIAESGQPYQHAAYARHLAEECGAARIEWAVPRGTEEERL